jgi:trimethylamine--corrinoid protein Co-methyltransferase
MTRKILEGIDVNEVTLAAELIRKVGPNGSYLGEKHTRDFMRGLSQGKLIDRRMYDSWKRDGGKDMRERAHEEAIRILETHKVEPLPEHVRKEIENILAEANDEIKEKK